VSIHDDRMRRFCEAGLYFVTSQALSEGRSTIDSVHRALVGGITLIQLREKDLPIAAARAIAPDLIIGASSHTIAEAQDAQANGAHTIALVTAVAAAPNPEQAARELIEDI